MCGGREGVGCGRPGGAGAWRNFFSTVLLEIGCFCAFWAFLHFTLRWKERNPAKIAPNAPFRTGFAHAKGAALLKYFNHILTVSV